MTNDKIFLRGIWKLIQDEDDTDWIVSASKNEFSNEPLGDFGSILKEMLDKGIDPKTIARLFKIVEYELAFKILYHLGDPIASYEEFPESEQMTSWALYVLNNETDEPVEELYGLHESLLSMDPTGREMAPKNASDN